jgi:hypothetical protein
MKPRTSLLLAVVAVLVLGAAWQFGLRTEPAEQETVARGTLVFPGLVARLAQARRVEITHQGHTLVIADAGGVWGLPDRGGYPVEPDRLRELLTGLTELRITEPRTSNPAEYAQLGVEDPQAAGANSNLVRVLDGAGKPLAALIVGHSRTRTLGNLPPSVFIRRPGEAQSFLAEGSLPVDADPQLWLTRNIIDIGHGKITGVTVHRGGETLVFGRTAGKFGLLTPADHPKLDSYKIDDVGSALEQLTLTDVKPAAQEPGSKIGTAAFVTSDGMTVTVTVFRNAQDIWAQFAVAGTGAAAADAAKLQAAIGKWAYQLGSWKAQALVPTLADLKADTPATPAVPAPAPAAAPAPAPPAAPAPAK